MPGPLPVAHADGVDDPAAGASDRSTVVASTADAPADLASPVLDDHDVVDEHRIRRTRLGNALRRGTTAPRPGPTWRTAAVGVVLAALALGGTAVGSAVHRHLPGARPATSGVSETQGSPDSSARSGPAPQEGAGRPVPGPVPPALGGPSHGAGSTAPSPGETGARPYGSWIAPGAAAPPAQNGEADQTTR
ncbi:hypothetical protein MOPEL_029_00820 [Mobilicoccus pelagius NBRC 104925]|uniref:Uncharacterized protein n=1 Tax=Mobilicoccus pelagius NBRC 104925 TaxID=1089455 RepID=H5UPZ6_9MICO|nr:hypothetical protein MOPEL_029_00820 [Mobilicoccus pelagius NBRC 104925]